MALAASAFWAVAQFCAPLFVGAPALETRRAAELLALRQSLGGQVEAAVRRFAAPVRVQGPSGTRAAVPPSAGALASPRPAVREFPSGAGAAGAPFQRATAGFLPGYVHRLGLQWQVAALRAGIVLAWVVALGPLLAAALVDGWMQGAIRRMRAGAAHPVAFSLSGIAAAGLLSVPLAYILVPVPWPSGWAPAWALLTSLVLSWRSALQRSLAPG